MARPIPREPPVTSAVLPSNDAKASGSGKCLLELVQALGAGDRDRPRVAIDPLDKAGKDVPRTDLDESLHALADQLLGRLRESNRSSQLIDEQRAHPLRVLDLCG